MAYVSGFYKDIRFFFVVGLIISSALAELFVWYEKSLVNIVAVIPFFVFLPPLLWTRFATPIMETLALAGLLIIGISVMPLQQSTDIAAVTRLGAYALYLVYYLLCYNVMHRYSVAIKYIWLGTMWGVLFILVISNLVNRNIGFSPYYIAFIRYEGILGPNLHGITSALGAMSAVALGAFYKKTRFSIILSVIFLYTLANIWITGSRASLLTVAIFWFILILFRGKNFARLSVVALIIIVLLLISINMERISELAIFLRLDDYSLQGRIEPLLWAFEQIKDNFGFPYGLGVMNEIARAQHLDNSFLMIALELGFFGVLLIGIFLLYTIRSAWFLWRFSKRDPLLIEKDVYSVNTAAIIALVFYGAFETYLLSSLHIGTLQFLALSAWFNTKFRLLRVRCRREAGE